MIICVEVPNGVSGNWEVEEFEITEEGARLANMRALRSYDKRFVKPGKYKRLSRSGETIMSNTPAEIRDHQFFIDRAKQGGSILINGLGLGVALTEILTSEKVTSVTVIEQSSDVIAVLRKN